MQIKWRIIFTILGIIIGSAISGGIGALCLIVSILDPFTPVIFITGTIITTLIFFILGSKIDNKYK